MEILEIITLTILIIVFFMLCFVLFVMIKSSKNTKQAEADPNQLISKINLEVYKLLAEQTEKSMGNMNLMVNQIRSSLEERFERLTEKNANELSKVLDNLNQVQQKFLETNTTIIKTVSDEMVKVNQTVQNRLDFGFEQTKETFNNVIARLAIIDKAQNNIEKLSSEVIQLQDILKDKKSRGNFGEFQLNQILYDVYGESRDLYDTQKTLSNGTRVDAIIYMPENGEHVCIDSKFPLNSYQQLQDRNLPESEQKRLELQFKADIKKHIDDIANKYIIKNETAEQALMFIPSEAIFYYIIANHVELVQYSQKKSVVITSPTTIIALLKLFRVAIIDYKRRQNTQKIIIELGKLSSEFERYIKRWNDVKKSIDQVKANADKLDVTNEKISDRFDNIYKMKELDSSQYQEIEEKVVNE